MTSPGHAHPDAVQSVYEAELAEPDGATADYQRKKLSGSGTAVLRRDDEVTFWVYSAADAESTLRLETVASGDAVLRVNGTRVADVKKSTTAQVVLSGGVNKVTVTGVRGTTVIDRLLVEPTAGALRGTTYQAEDAILGGSAAVADRSLAANGKAVTGIGGEPGNENTLTFDVSAPATGRYALTIRYANPEQSPATHYNPDPLARHADLAINGAHASRIVFPHTFHQNNFWDLTVQVDLVKGSNTLAFSSQELPGFDGTTLISDTFPDVLLRSQFAPDVDSVTVTPFSKVATATGPPWGNGRK